MHYTAAMIRNKQTVFILGFTIYFILMLGGAVFAKGDVKGVQPVDLAATLYSKTGGAGYHGTFFIKSQELLNISNTMLRKSGVQYTLTDENTKSRLKTYVALDAPSSDDKALSVQTAKSTSYSALSFFEVNQKLAEQSKEAERQTAFSPAGGLLFSDVAMQLTQ